MPRNKIPWDRKPLWYKEAVIYQVHVRAFWDSNDDGIGDFKGLAQKLDYLLDLGVTAIWLLPFYPSPLKDDGYDIANYRGIHPHYGKTADFEYLLRQAHARGLYVITELVLNHTSDQHAWFQRARHAPPNSRWRNYYVWSDSPDKFKDARIIFKDFEASNWTWDSVAQAYYWHRFYSHQPDLNFDNPEVRRTIKNIIDLWMDIGVDGVRLDAVPYLYEREGTTCENLPETHEFLKELRRHIDEKYDNRMLLAEANQWPDDVLAYFGGGEECHMAFHFPLMPRLFMALQREDRFPILDIMEQTPAIPDSCQWAVFLRNHDELTLEMVTDEDRDYMYRVYADDPQARINLGIRRRLAPLLKNNRRRIELMNALLFALPGSPIIYYGDEIGMGDNIYLGDRNGVRTPMQWSADRNAGFSRANPQKLFLPVIIDPEYHYETVNVEAQHANTQSLLWWMKRIIALRKKNPVFGFGSLEFLHPENRKVLAFLRHYQDHIVLVVANLSRFAQFAELDLSRFQDMTPVEMLGQTHFPRIGAEPYLITLGPHSFYWFSLETTGHPSDVAEAPSDRAKARPVFEVRSWHHLWSQSWLEELMEVLPAFLMTRRWFGGKRKDPKTVAIADKIVLEDGRFCLLFLHVEYTAGDTETYLLPLAWARGEAQEDIKRESPSAVLAGLVAAGETAIVFEAFQDKDFCAQLLQLMRQKRRLKGQNGFLLSHSEKELRDLFGKQPRLDPELLKVEQSNTSVRYGTELILKVFRKLEEGINPDLELTRFLTEEVHFAHIPPFVGALEYYEDDRQMALGILQRCVHNEGDAWGLALDQLDDYFERISVLRKSPENKPLPMANDMTTGALSGRLPKTADEIIGASLGMARLLGQRTGELHIALASRRDLPDFAPENFTPFYQRSVYQSLRSQVAHGLEILEQSVPQLSGALQSSARAIIAAEHELMDYFRLILTGKFQTQRIRCHGDYHLGQVLSTGKDFVVIDFEGEPARPLIARRRKQSPFRDLAGMVRSFHYAAFSRFLQQQRTGLIRPEEYESFEPWIRNWYQWVSVAFLKSYLKAVSEKEFIARSEMEFRLLLQLNLVEKALYELEYELQYRPEWAAIPLQGLLDFIQDMKKTHGT